MKITLATVTFQAETLLADTIRSVESQTYPHIEHLIVDGNSTDGTLPLVHRYQERNSVAPVPHEIVCLSEPDDGIYDAMNKALARATGQYVCFLNAGDRLPSPQTIADLVARIREVAAGKDGLHLLPAVVYGQTMVVDAGGNILRPRHLTAPARLTWRSLREGMLVCHQAFYARRDVAAAEPYDLRYRFSADFDWCIRILRRAEREHIPVLDSGMTLAHFLDGGTTTRHHRASLVERFRIMCRWYGTVPTCLRHAAFALRALRRRGA